MTRQLWISTTLWGAWHHDVFARFCRPNFLANMRDADCKLILHTRKSEVDQLIPGLPHGTEIFPDVPEDATSELGWSADAQSSRWKFDMARAKTAGANIAFLPPDIAWGPGVLARYVELLSAGAGVIYHHLPRVNLDTAAGELEGVTGNCGLAKIALEHEHHLGYRFRVDSSDYPTHCENVSVTSDHGILTRLLAGAPMAIDPSKCGFNHLAMPDRTAPGMLAVIRDSDEAIGLSLAPADKDLNWMKSGKPLDVGSIQAWLRAYTTPISPELARQSYRLHAAPVEPKVWKAAEVVMDRLMDEVFSARAVAA